MQAQSVQCSPQAGLCEGPNSEFETNWLQVIPFSEELTNNYW